MSGSLSFYSDNSSGAHPEVLQAIEAANGGHALGYGEDEHTRRAEAAFARHFGDDIQVLSVVNGSAANVVAVAGCCQPYEAVIATSAAHLAWAECGAIERLVGCKVLEVPHRHGKIDLDAARRLVTAEPDVHASRPRLLSITQATEVVTVYTPAEIEEIAGLAHAHGLLLHVDGARIANAAVSLGMGLRECTRDLGVDLLSFGGTKNGLLMGEAVVAFTPLAHLDYVRKQGLQLLSKMRFVSAQFSALLEGDLWHRNAAHANAMAAHLAARLREETDVEILHPVEANGVFVRLRPEVIEATIGRFPYYVFDKEQGVARLMTTWDTTREFIDGFVDAVRSVP